MNNRKSFVRFYFLLITISSFLLVVSMLIFENEVVKFLCFVSLLIPSFSILFVKCEQCGAKLYRYTEKDHGIPIKGWEKAIKEDCCPSCGFERYGLFDGLVNIFK